MFCVSDLAILVAFVMVGRCWVFLARLGPLAWSAGMCVCNEVVEKQRLLVTGAKYQKGLCVRPVIKSVVLENVLITLFFPL